jgi:hypothetical protein
MSSNRYFLKLHIRAQRTAAFKSRENANTVQAEIEKAIFVLHRQNLELTGLPAQTQVFMPCKTFSIRF